MASPASPSSPWVERTFPDAQSRSVVRYLLCLPAAYETAPGPWPLILFLHGAAERGEDLELVKREGLPRILERHRDFPFAVVSPQCPRRRRWSLDVLDRLLTDVLGRLRVD